jgi:hypothetical protein
MSPGNSQIAQRLLILVLLAIVTIGLSSCEKKRTGVYVTKDLHPAPYIELKPDRTYYIERVPGKSSSGTYEVDGNTLTLTDQTGVTTKAVFLSDGSLFAGGVTFVKK